MKEWVNQAKKRHGQKEFGHFIESSYKDNIKLFYQMLKNLGNEKESPIEFNKDKDRNLIREKVKQWNVGKNTSKNCCLESNPRQLQEKNLNDFKFHWDRRKFDITR